jgi:hypothetical protein
MDNNNVPTVAPPGRWQFRFGLKTLFIIMTVSCVWLGWRMARQRQAAAMVARSRAVMDVIDGNMSTPPQGTSFVMPPHLRQQTASFLTRTRPDPSNQTKQVSNPFGDGRFYSMSTRGEPLDITKLLATGNAAAASVQIRNQYERGLAKLGLQRALTSDGEKATSIWGLPEHGLHVIIDVDSDTARNQADVRVIFLHSEELKAW